MTGANAAQEAAAIRDLILGLCDAAAPTVSGRLSLCDEIRTALRPDAEQAAS